MSRTSESMQSRFQIVVLAAWLPQVAAYAPLLPPARVPAASSRCCAAAQLLEAPAEAALSMPPDSFNMLLDEAAAATDLAIADGQLLIEVEFPPVPISKLEDSSLSAYDILSANLQFVVEYAKRLKKDDATGAPRKIALTLPDASERSRSIKFYGDDEPWPGMRLWSLNGGDKEAEEGRGGWAMASLPQGRASSSESLPQEPSQMTAARAGEGDVMG